VSQVLPYDPDQVPRGPRKALLERTPKGSSVLDVGCWSGFAGRFLRYLRVAQLDGVEPHPDMARRAERDYRNVYCMPVEQAADALLSRAQRYDVLLFLDVLEHLIAPGEILQWARSLVKPDGIALVSLPNVAHWSVRKELLLGRWQYTDSGVLDRTHLRFFTNDTARDLAASAGWRITHTDMALSPPPPLRGLSQDRLSPLRRWPGLFAVQMLFELQPA
jgi:2-polyprenyl-3-methyl-5-hydroxy-6-metoxy-1,4-benzoquinol methylase